MTDQFNLVAIGLLAGSILATVAICHPVFRRSGEESGSLRATAACTVAVGLLVGMAIAMASRGGALLFAGLLQESPWNQSSSPHWVAVACVAALLLLHRSDSSRLRWPLVSAGVACVVPFASHLLMGPLGDVAGADPVGPSLVASVMAALVVSRGSRRALVGRAREAAISSAGDGILVLDDRGRLLDANATARKMLKLSTRSARLGELPEAPKSVRDLVIQDAAKRVKLKSASGSYYEAWTTRKESSGPLQQVRGIVLRDVTNRHASEQKLVRLAHYDSLTGLANRRLFLEMLAKAIEDAKPMGDRVALYYVDLDHFKAINDSLGHGAGDALLQTLAERFRSHLGSSDLAALGLPADTRIGIARLAGDEFAIVAEGITDTKGAAELAQWILGLIARPMNLADRILTTSGSAGFAMFPDDGEDVQTLLRHADSALYVAKSRGRKRSARFESSYETKANRARSIEEGLQEAIERKELRVHYQPKVDLTSGTVVGFESLLRWTSSELGVVGPAEFIPVAESRGLISELGSWCLDETCRQLRSWSDAGWEVVPISVNVSSAQFTETDMQRVVSDALKRHHVDPHLLELELTESLLLEEGEATELCLRDLRAIGIRIALDDFGTGYSALTYLNRFNLDVLKIDRALLVEIDTNASAAGIASAVVSMAHSLGLTVVAEGIDTETQLNPLRLMKCDQIQGFLYSQALPSDEACGYLARVGEEPPVVKPSAGPPGARATQRSDPPTRDDEAGLPALKSADEIPAARRVAGEPAAAPAEETRRLLIVDDGSGELGPIALRLGRLGIEIHYASEPQEAHLFVAQEQDTIRLLAAPPSIDLAEAEKVLQSLTEKIGMRPPFVILGEEPDEERRASIREAGVDWVLWAPFKDVELRYLVRSAMTPPSELSQRVQPRMPVDMVANVRAGDRREVAVMSSLSPRGAFIELSDPMPVGSQLQLEFDLPGERFRGFARVVHQQLENLEDASIISGVGVVFFGIDRDMTRTLLDAVQERETRYRP